MSYVSLEKKNNYYQLNLTAGDTGNTFKPEVVAEWNAALDELPSVQEAPNTALVVTSGHAKMFSAGIDLGYIKEHGFPVIAKTFIPELEALLLRVSQLDMPTIAGINGHAYGGGALIATACDFRIMRGDKGRFCFPEIDLPIVFGPIMMQLLNSRIPQTHKERLCLTGEAIGGDVLADIGLALSAPTAESFESSVADFAELMAKKDRKTYAGIKQGLIAGMFA